MSGSHTFSASTNLLIENAITHIVGNISRKVDGTVSHGIDPNSNTLSFIRELQSIISRYDEADVRMFCGILRNASKPIYNSIKTRSEMLAFAASLSPSALPTQATVKGAVVHRVDTADKKVKNATKPARKAEQTPAPVALAAAEASLKKRPIKLKKDVAAPSATTQKKAAATPKPAAPAPSAPPALKTKQDAPKRQRGRPVKKAAGKTALERLNQTRIDRANKYKRRTKGQ